MFARNVIAKEQEFHDGYVRRNYLRAGEFGAISVFDYQKPTSVDYYYTDQCDKNLVVLHHTLGWLWGDIPTLTQADYHVSVAFVIGRSGRIYRLFNPKFWSNHLGRERDVAGGNIYNSKRSIAIEISNVGSLTLKDNTLLFNGSPYCETTEPQYYTKLAQPFRGERFFASFTDEQYASLDALLREIEHQFNIPRNFLPANKRFLVFGSDEEARRHKGIASHVNFRRTGKNDIGPAFEWNRISG